MAEVDTFGLRVWRGEVAMMAEPHRHHELELNLILNGSVTYLFGGQRLTLETGQLMLFWGTLPHRLLDCQKGTVCGWLTLPLAIFLRYGLPEKLTQRVLHGEPVIQAMRQVDKALFEQWVNDWQYPTAEKQDVLELELGAWLRRLSLTLKTGSKTKVKQRSDNKLQDSKAAKLAEFMSEHYQEPLQLRDVAKAANLNESYAATLFKDTFSMTMLDYLTQHRIAHAQRLLVTTDKRVLEIAFEAGFGSSSQFYAAFVKACGQTPLAYRKKINP
jgi:AraC family transcriptional regulator, melibiose operon regulatory protein